eukprot:TRINITY_DN3469_c0_g1_i1.p1 TRINITY_DN3469_c0_g1~~TRINITY_DN3469_c0_g1_i1.p1  ORF type:complete len:463 (+),score=197.66 TRINITY_DN3469_c0_g1_i1:58-1446(+)
MAEGDGGGPAGLTCGVWVPLGVCKQMPDKYEPTDEELARARAKVTMLAAEAQEAGDEDGAAPSDEDMDAEDGGEKGEELVADPGEVPEMDEEEEEEEDDDGPVLDNIPAQGVEGLHDIESDDASELNDLNIRPDDMVFLCTHQRQNGNSSLEVYVYDEEPDNIYLHHDIQLPAIPLCVAWTSCGPKNGAVVEDGSFAAVTTFLPFIEVWDLDVLDHPDPAITLGGCKRESDNYRAKTLSPSMLKKDSHKDAVLCARWNPTVKKCLASGSADCTVKLWDLGTGGALHTFNVHQAPIQTMEWFPQNPETIITGSFDQTANILDCRSQKTHLKVNLKATPEAFAVSPFADHSLFVTTDSGLLMNYDLRKAKKPLWKVNAHEGEAGGLAVNPAVDGLVATAGIDNNIKLWDVRGDPTALCSRDLGQGRVFSLQFNKDKPTYLLGSGDGGKPLVYCVTDDVKAAFNT